MACWIINFLLSLLLAPLLTGIINKTKAFFAGRKGAPILQPYFDLAKLVSKSLPRSSTSTWIFDIAPAVSLSTAIIACLFLPWGMSFSPLAVKCDAVIFFYLLGTGRFFTVLGAMDTGSAFEGMGSSREVQFSALAEPVIFAVLGFLALSCGVDETTLSPLNSSLSGMLTSKSSLLSANLAAPTILAAAAFFIVALSENCRVPFDDPETHLELTMIHEAMILDNSGPDLAMILYGASLRLWTMCAFFTMMIIPKLSASPLLNSVVSISATCACGVIIGAIESSIARMRFVKTPLILLGAAAAAILAIVLTCLST